MKDLDYMIAVMQAAKEGKVIERRVRDRNSWVICRDPDWDWCLFEFRVKPEPRKPREWKASVKRDNGELYHHDADDLKFPDYLEIVTVREVLPE